MLDSVVPNASDRLAIESRLAEVWPFSILLSMPLLICALREISAIVRFCCNRSLRTA